MMQIKVKEAPEGAVFEEGIPYQVYGEKYGGLYAFTFDENGNSYYLSDLVWEVFGK